jgi:hypothetical protein
MRGAPSHRKNEEHGPWYEIQCVKNDIINKESRGENATFERELLKNWAKYPGWESARDALFSLTKSKSRRV